MCSEVEKCVNRLFLRGNVESKRDDIDVGGLAGIDGGNGSVFTGVGGVVLGVEIVIPNISASSCNRLLIRFAVTGGKNISEALHFICLEEVFFSGVFSGEVL